MDQGLFISIVLNFIKLHYKRILNKQTVFCISQNRGKEKGALHFHTLFTDLNLFVFAVLQFFLLDTIVGRFPTPAFPWPSSSPC